MASQISLRRTGIIVFTARIASIFTGLAFLVMMTRSLSAEQFGLWEVVIDIVTFAAYPAGLVAFWATRDIARGKMFGKTAVLINFLLSLLGIGLYFVFSLVSAPRISADISTLTLAVLLVPISYWNQAANAVVSGHKPSVLGFAVIVSEVAKLAVAFPLLIIYKTGIEGVILSVIVANLAQSAASTLLAGDALSNPVEIGAARRWLSNSWLPVLTTLPLMFGIADTYVASLAAAGTSLVGYYQAAYSVAAIAGYSYYLASAMYPLLLRGGDHSVTARTLEFALLVGIPMATGGAALAKPILYFLNPVYADGSLALSILCFAVLVNTVSMVFDQTLSGRDKVDVDESSRFRDFLGSNLLFVAKVNLAVGVTYVAAVYAVVAVGLSSGLSVPAVLELWATAQLLIIGGFVLVKLKRIGLIGQPTFARSELYYAAGALVMGVSLWLLGGLIQYKVGSLRFALELGAVSLTGLGIYGAFVLAVDDKLRALARRVVRETFF